MTKKYLVDGVLYDLNGLADFSGKSVRRIQIALESGKTPTQAVLPSKEIVSESGRRKYVERDPDELIEFNGMRKTLFEWARYWNTSIRNVHTYIQKGVSDKKKYIRQNCPQKVYRVRYYLFHLSHTEVRFADVDERELKAFLYDHVFARVTGVTERGNQ